MERAMNEMPSAVMSLAERQIDLLPLGICVIDKDLNVLRWNRTLASWTGIRSDVAVGTNLLLRYTHLKSPRFLHRINGVFQSGQPALFSPSSVHPFIPISTGGDDCGSTMLQRVVIELHVVDLEEDQSLIQWTLRISSQGVWVVFILMKNIWRS